MNRHFASAFFALLVLSSACSSNPDSTPDSGTPDPVDAGFDATACLTQCANLGNGCVGILSQERCEKSCLSPEIDRNFSTCVTAASTCATAAACTEQFVLPPTVAFKAGPYGNAPRE